MDDYNYGGQPPRYDQKDDMAVGYSHGSHVVQSQPTSNNVIVVGQQNSQEQVLQRPWTSGLFDCFDDMSICVCATFCGICLVCQIASDLKESKWVPCCVPSALTALRVKWRTQNNIEGGILNDCCLETFCGPCALCQLAREVKQAKVTNTFRLH